MSPRRTILLLTLSENGQANTLLAITSELARHADTDIHIASFPILQHRVKILKCTPGATITFHTVSGLSYIEAANRDTIGKTFAEAIIHPPTSKSLRMFKDQDVTKILLMWRNDEHLRQVLQLKELISRVDPDIIVVDFLFSAAHDACRALDRRRVVNYPMQTLDFVLRLQPRYRSWWMYPA